MFDIISSPIPTKEYVCIYSLISRYIDNTFYHVSHTPLLSANSVLLLFHNLDDDNDDDVVPSARESIFYISTYNYYKKSSCTDFLLLAPERKKKKCLYMRCITYPWRWGGAGV